jgi:hypothetical protein
MRNDLGKGAEIADKGEPVNSIYKTGLIRSNDQGICNLENHHKNPK